MTCLTQILCFTTQVFQKFKMWTFDHCGECFYNAPWGVASSSNVGDSKHLPRVFQCSTFHDGIQPHGLVFENKKKHLSKIHDLFHDAMNYGDGIVLWCMFLFLLLFIIFSKITTNQPIKLNKKSFLLQIYWVICAQLEGLNVMTEYVH